MKLLKAIILSIFLFPLNHMLSKENEELVFCFVGDAGEVTQSQTEVTQALYESDCSLIWYLGDITQPGIDKVDDPEFVERFLNPFNKILGNKIPFYLIVGNHDYKKDPYVYIDIAKKYPLLNHPNNYYTKKFGDLCFFALDTTIFDKLYLFYKRWGHINWLKSSIEEQKKDCKFSIAVAHHPLFSSGDRDSASPQLAIFLESYVFGTFDIYITGHNHVLADEGDRKGTTQLISAAASLPGGSPEKAPEGKFNVETPGYLRLVMEDSDIASYKFIDAKTKNILWSKSKEGSGVRTKSR